MPELTSDQAIAKLKTLKPDEQRLVLSRLTPEKRMSIVQSFTPEELSTQVPGKGEGLYTMYGKLGTKENPEAVGQISIPYSKVPAAQMAGYTWFGQSKDQYEKDKAAEGKEPTAFGTAIDKFEKSIQPVPSSQDAAAHQGAGVLDNTDRAALRVLYGIPGFMRDVAYAAEELRSGRDPEAIALTNLLDPSKIPQQLTEQFQQDWKSGDRRLAVSNLIGSLAGMAIAHKATGAVKEVAGKIPTPKPESLRSAVRETMGVPEQTESVVKKFGTKAEAVRRQHAMAEKRTAADTRAVDARNEKIQKDLKAKNEIDRQKVNDANLKQIQKEAQARLDVLKANRNKTQDYEEKVKQTKAENEQNLRREKMLQKVASQLNDASKRLYVKYQKAFKTATKTYNDTWNKWRDLVKTQMAPMKTVVDTIKAQEASMNPQQQSIFRDILRESKPDPEEMTQFERDRDSAMQNLGYKGSYDDLPPDRKLAIDDMMQRIGYTNLNDVADVEVPASRLHGWKSQLERAVRTTSDGTIRYAIGKVLQQVRGLEEQVSANVPGAAEQLTRARGITGPYFDAFFKSPDELPKEAGRSLLEQSPEYAKEKAQQERLNRIAAYDPTITGLAQHVDNLRSALKQIPKPKGFQDLPPKPVHVPRPESKPLATFTPETKEPVPYKESHDKAGPAKVPNLTDENAAFIGDKLRKYGRWGPWIVRLIAGGLASHALFKGDLSAFSNDLLIGQAAVTLLTNALRKPSVLQWLAEPSKEDLQMIETLPPEDAVRMREALGTLSREEIRQNPDMAKFKIAPAMASFLAGQSIQKVTPQSYQQTATGAGGHKIGSNDGGETWYDVETGKQVK